MTDLSARVGSRLTVLSAWPVLFGESLTRLQVSTRSSSHTAAGLAV